MNIPVHMFAFADKGDRSKVRIVRIPDTEAKYVKMGDLLELVFKYGQNDFQPKNFPSNFPSVSVGDIVEVGDEYYMVAPIGYKELTDKEFLDLIPPTSSYGHDLY